MKEISYDGPSFDTKKALKTPRSTGSNKAPTVRTFRADVEELIQEKGTTKSQIIMAEAARRESRGERRVLHEEEDSHLGLMIFVLILVLAFGLGIGAYALIGTKISLPFLNTATSTAVAPTPTPEELGIVISNSPREQILADISIAFGKTSLPAGMKRPVVFFSKDASGTARPATTAEFINGILPQLSNHNITRSLDSAFTYEIRSNTALSGVLTLPSRFYADSFATMLEWEKSLANDLIPVLNAWYDRKFLKELSGKPFKDERLGNSDARVLYDSTGNSVLAYGFSNKKTLVIAGNRETLESTLIALSQTK